jgi:hypothetical protein
MACGLDGIRASLPSANAKVDRPATLALPAGVRGHTMPRRRPQTGGAALRTRSLARLMFNSCLPIL